MLFLHSRFLWALASSGALFIIVLCFAKARVAGDDRAFRGMIASPIDMDWGTATPPVKQESIDKALAYFGIEKPPNVRGPYLDLALTDRGLTIHRPKTSSHEVLIGPAAFTSWAMLGSTLAHELEVHCRQHLGLIGLASAAGLASVDEAEREAYGHELKNARRFGLSQTEIEEILAIKHYHYPRRHQNVFLRALSRIGLREPAFTRFWSNEAERPIDPGLAVTAKRPYGKD